MIDDTARDHQAGVECASGDSSKRVPCPVIEPVPEGVEAMGDEVFRGAEVEPRVDCKKREMLVYLGQQKQDVLRKRPTKIHGSGFRILQ